MPFSSAQQRICVDCGSTFEAMSYNQARCPGCQSARNRHRAHAIRDDVTRINLYIENNDYLITCPRCQQHMTRCQCPDPTVKPFQSATVATWRPWQMNLNSTDEEQKNHA